MHQTDPAPKTAVVTGGTDGIGRALAESRLRRGDTVVIVGRDPDKGAAFLAHARESGVADRASFIRADLSLLAGNRGYSPGSSMRSR
ncbi:NAD(P)-dependent dehydrogenase (short-subunit alcohol dehydrogenase family) [Streptomyces canus]|uniref:NAD(P)-dependent dehydrogenase (Short-subunit alcohol dehydrogenase family) n=1 Tax=Streptomyces canus TaxID=58343 RepID=A0AAW8F7G4_9ACTN|nr:SDR family NAD(P)-dependent oxidoreductase [Streptomyces canus]MDQ0906047.1 NAD(P)-dependent dehydrogenase (short-subunit alcohol dehydrogenase family) [Streptomyces canus]